MDPELNFVNQCESIDLDCFSLFIHLTSLYENVVYVNVTLFCYVMQQHLKSAVKRFKLHMSSETSHECVEVEMHMADGRCVPPVTDEYNSLCPTRRLCVAECVINECACMNALVCFSSQTHRIREGLKETSRQRAVMSAPPDTTARCSEY